VTSLAAAQTPAIEAGWRASLPFRVG